MRSRGFPGEELAGCSQGAAPGLEISTTLVMFSPSCKCLSHPWGFAPSPHGSEPWRGWGKVCRERPSGCARRGSPGLAAGPGVELPPGSGGHGHDRGRLRALGVDVLEEGPSSGWLCSLGATGGEQQRRSQLQQQAQDGLLCHLRFPAVSERTHESPTSSAQIW